MVIRSGIPKGDPMSTRSTSESFRASDRGMALLVVLLVILALSIIATPLVLSTLSQEKSAKGLLSRTQADYGGMAARNYAVSRLHRTHDLVERRNTTDKTAYVWDGPAEWDICVQDPPLAKSLNLSSEAGLIAGVVVADEQGKANWHSAKDIRRFADTLKSLVDFRIADVKDFTTLYSIRPARWIHPQRVRGIDSSQGFSADDLSHYGKGARLRFTKPGMKPFITAVGQNPLAEASSPPFVRTVPQLPQVYEDGTVEVERRHPVNVNTARREVLIALFDGVRLAPNEKPITRDDATKIADQFYRKTTRTMTEFLQRLLDIPGLKDPGKLLAAALNAIDPTHALLDGSGTLPICFLSSDVFTIDAASSMNNPVGAPLATRGFREVVAVTPPTLVEKRWESQFDFDEELGYFDGGFPLGNRMETFPVFHRWRTSGTGMLVKSQIDARLDEELRRKILLSTPQSYFQLKTSEDNRGSAQYLNNREHFSTTQEGTSSANGLSWDRSFVFTPNPNPPTSNASQNQPDIAAGGMEMFVRFESIPTQAILFDIRESDHSNRLTLEIQNGELIFTAADTQVDAPATAYPLDNGVARVRRPFLPELDTWYHIGAYWKGTKYGHLCLMVNGFSHPATRFEHVNDGGQRMMTRLSAPLSATQMTLSLKDASILVPGEYIPLEIGREVIEHDATTGAIVRGARGTIAADHPADAAVQVFGYTSRLRRQILRLELPGGLGTIVLPYSRIPIGGSKLLSDFGAIPSALVQGDKTNPNTGQTYVDDQQNFIRVTTPNISEWPTKGYVAIDQEVIYYDARQGGSPAQLTGCLRGQMGTAPSDHDTGAPIQLFSVYVDSTVNYDSPTIIQVDDEWIGPVQRNPDASKPNFWVGFVMTGTGSPVPVAPQRGVLFSVQKGHAVNEDVIPTFMAHDTNTGDTRFNCEREDRVIVVSETNAKERRRVRRSSLVQSAIFLGTVFQGAQPRDQLAAFWDNVSRDYVADTASDGMGRYVRIMKFPSGELLGMQWIEAATPKFTIGPFSATVDELKFFASPKANFRVEEALDRARSQVVMNGAGGLPGGGGAVLLGDEIVGYAEIGGNTLNSCRRGYLESPAQIHDAGDRAFNLSSFLPVAALGRDIDAEAESISLSQTLSGNISEGYVLIDEEVVGFFWQNGNALRMSKRFSGGGLLRGCFGTTPAEHSKNALAYAIPFRFWDSYKPGEFDHRMAYFQASTNIPEARWDSCRWTAEVPAADPNLRTHVLMRLDGVNEFTDPPNGRTLFDFTDGTAKNGMNRIGFQGEPGQLDLRILFEYRPGSFHPNVSWMRAVRIHDISVFYERPVRVLYHEER